MLLSLITQLGLLINLQLNGVYLIYGMDYGMDWWNGLMEWNIS